MNNRDLEFVAGQAGDVPAELVSVDDLQVAAAAAAAAMGEPTSSSSEESSSDESSTDAADSSSDEAMSSEEESSSDEDDEGGFLAERWRMSMAVDESSNQVSVQLAPHFQLSSREGLAPMEAAPDSDYEASSSSEEDEDSDDDEDIIEIHDYDDLRRVIDSMDADTGGGGDAGGGPSAAEALFGAAPPPELDVKVTEEDTLVPAGKILSVIEGTVVVRAAAGSRALNEGSVLVLGDRRVIGAVEDIFGPVQAPLYAFRYIPIQKEGKIDMENELKPEMTVFSVDRLSDFVAEESLRVKGYDGDLTEEGDGGAVDPEQQFSDDEAEAQYKRKLKAKRKGEQVDGAGGGGNKPSRHKGPPSGGSGGGRGRGGGGSRGRGRGNSFNSAAAGAGGGSGPMPPHHHQHHQSGYAPAGYAQPPPPGYYPGPPPQQYNQPYPQYLGQYYAQNAMPQYYPPGGHGATAAGAGTPQRGQFQAHATAGQLGAMSLQPHHVYGAPQQQPRPPPPAGPKPPPPPQG